MIVDFSSLKLNDLTPIYTQIIRFVKMGIVSKQVSTGDVLPSRRLLSSMLNVNPNTIQKAYREMEEEGLIISYPGSKSLLTFDDKKAKSIKEELINLETTHYIEAVKGMGIELLEAIKLLEGLW
ncbi:GntR family transcriptional regulator [Clostridium sp. Marseille-P299]|uniref:GntR family transcriptional regulator n=1 Tax=Clostridium sp. Marseille-P299 TaxID=1805477 RepID=UPI000835AF8E|nr:GntR family transcriptional regulator [Clostridium sp. Marseille-P299]